MGKDLKRSIDWIVSDESAHLFVECKTKPLRFNAKSNVQELGDFYEDLDKLAGFVLQTYKTLNDALQGRYPHWKPDSRPVFPIVLTLEDWHVFAEHTIPYIDKKVSEKLIEIGIAPDLMSKYPYTICSASEFEAAMQIISSIGIDSFVRPKTKGEKRLWLLHAYMAGEFSGKFSACIDLFPDVSRRIMNVVTER